MFPARLKFRGELQRYKILTIKAVLIPTWRAKENPFCGAVNLSTDSRFCLGTFFMLEVRKHNKRDDEREVLRLKLSLPVHFILSVYVITLADFDVVAVVESACMVRLSGVGKR